MAGVLFCVPHLCPMLLGLHPPGFQYNVIDHRIARGLQAGGGPGHLGGRLPVYFVWNVRPLSPLSVHCNHYVIVFHQT